MLEGSVIIVMNQESNNIENNSLQNEQANNIPVAPVIPETSVMTPQPVVSQEPVQPVNVVPEPVNTNNNIPVVDNSNPIVQATQVVNSTAVVTPQSEVPNNIVTPNGNVPSNDNFFKKNKKLLIIGGIVLAVVAIVIVIILLFSGKGGLDLGLGELFGEEKEHAFVFLYKDDNGTRYYVDEKDKITSFSGYEELEEDFINGLAIYRKNVDGKSVYGIIDEKGKDIVEAGLYSSIERDAEFIDVFEVEKDEKVGIVDGKGNVVIPIEYDDIRTTYFSGTNVYVFLVEKEEQFKVLSANGTYIADAEDPGYWGSLGVHLLDRASDDSVGIIEYKEKYYNAVTGASVDIKYTENLREFYFKSNVYCEKDVGLTIFDNDANVKEKLSYPGIHSLDVYKTKTNHIVVIGSFEDETSQSFTNTFVYRIYDENFKFLKEGKLQDIYKIEVTDVNDEYFYLTINASFSETAEDSTILFDSKLNEIKRESKLGGHYYETVNGDIIYTESDYEKSYAVYNTKFEKLHTFDKYYGYTFTGNLFPLYDMSDRKNYAAINLNGEVIANGFDDYRLLYGDDYDVLVFEDYYNAETLVLANGKKINYEKFEWYRCGNILEAYNRSTKEMKLHDIDGNVFLEVTSEDTECYDDVYFTVDANSKTTLYDAETLKVVTEFNSENYLDNYYNSGVNIVELEDGFYNFDGKLVLSKTQNAN